MARFTNTQGQTVATAVSWDAYPPANYRHDRQTFLAARKAKAFKNLPELLTAEQFIAAVAPYQQVVANPCKRCKGSGHYSCDSTGDTTCYRCKGTGLND